jgi:hypothetical protein
MSTPYSQLFPITAEELSDLKKISTDSGTSSQYKNSKGDIFSITDVVTGKVSGDDAKAVSSGGSADKISDPDYGITNVRGASKDD